MADVQFDEDQEYSRPTMTTQESPLVRLVIATGLVKTKEQAEYLLLGIACTCIGITFFVLLSGMSQNHPSKATLEQASKMYQGQ